MSRKFITKKFIKDVLNDRYARQRAAIQSVVKVFLLYPYDDSKMARNGFLDEPSGKAERENGSKWCATSKTCSSAYKAGFVALRTYVYKAMNLCYILKVMN